MNRLVNALAFAAVVVAAFVMDSNLPQKLASCPRVARVMHSFAGNGLPTVGSLDGLPPQIDQARLDRAMERMQAAQERLVRVDMKRMEMRVQTAQRAAALGNCKVVKIDQ